MTSAGPALAPSITASRSLPTIRRWIMSVVACRSTPEPSALVLLGGGLLGMLVWRRTARQISL